MSGDGGARGNKRVYVAGGGGGGWQQRRVNLPLSDLGRKKQRNRKRLGGTICSPSPIASNDNLLWVFVNGYVADNACPKGMRTGGVFINIQEKNPSLKQSRGKKYLLSSTIKLSKGNKRRRAMN